MTTIAGPDCAVMCNLIDIHTRVCYFLLPLAMSSCDEVGSDVHSPYKGARHQMGRAQVGDKPHHLVERMKVARLRRRISLVYSRHFHSARVTISAVRG